MAVPTLITQLSRTAASNAPQGSDDPSVLDDVQRATSSFVAQLRDGSGFSAGVTLASAATVSLSSATSPFVEVTGSVGITSFAAPAGAGARFIRFTGAPLLTNSATLTLPGGANIQAAVGDTLIAVPNTAATGWTVTSYQRAGLQAASGANADITSLSGITSINGGQLAGYRNFFINGGMRVAQRGNVVFSASNNLYGGADRWFGSVSGSTVTALILQVTLAGTESGYAQQIGNVTTTGSTQVGLTQRVEALNATALNGKTITISGKVLQVSGATRTLTLRYLKSNTADNFNAGTTFLAQPTVSVPNNVLTPFSMTYTMGATDGSNGVGLVLLYDGLPALSNAQFYFADVQLEIGSVATAFESNRPYALEEAMCLRYFERIGYFRNDLYAASAASDQFIAVQFKARKRIAPTVTPVGVITSLTGVSYGLTNADHLNINTTGSVSGDNNYEWNYCDAYAEL